jgi:hypothetical protein
MGKVRHFTGKWLNTSVFREEAIHFRKNGYYCSAPANTIEWKKHWDREIDRCKNGYEVDGERITGQYYYYLNYDPINRITIDEDDKQISTTKEPDFPDFWDWDYEWYWWKEIARHGVLNKVSQAYNILTDSEKRRLNNKGTGGKGYSEAEKKDLKETILYKRLKLKLTAKEDCLDGGKHMILAKSRRKGFSYKMESDTSNNYHFFVRSQTIIGVSDSKYGDEPELFVNNHLSFIDEHTAFGKSRDFKDKADHKRASFQETIGGKKLEKGYMSEIYIMTFKDKADRARGRSPKEQYYEEAGTWVNLIDAYKASLPGTTAGKYVTGQHIVFGTGGKIAEDNGQFSEMFYNPISYDFMAFKNIWDEGAENTYCGFFFSALYNLEGFYDSQGNSDLEAALEFENTRRKRLLEYATSSMAYHRHVTEFPICPSESFGNAESGYFPVAELTQQYNRVIAENLHNKIGIPCNLMAEGNEVRVKPILHGAKPIHDFPIKDEKNLNGCVVIYEPPVEDCPRGLYKIGYDPYRQDQSNGPSLGSIQVYKGIYGTDAVKNTLVAEYTGRPYSADTVSGIALMLAILYNTEVMYENEVTHVKTYFQNKKQLDRLAAQPDSVISKNIQNSKVSRVYGCHMNEKMKDAGEKYIRDWLLEVNNYNEKDEPIYVYQTIYSPSLLQQLIKYNRKQNFDQVMALMQVMFQVQEDIEKVYTKEQKIHRRTEEFMNLYKN